MNCEQYQEQISQFIDGELLQTAETELFAHLGVCEHCRTFLKNVLSLKNTMTFTQQIAVPASLDRRVLVRDSSTIKKSLNKNFVRRFAETTYSFRTIGLAIILSALTGVLFSSFWHTSNQQQQTIVCLTPLPEVEVTGYVVVAPSPTKGIKQ
jgi:predicted anti-sigma-YlaC factor YlaD